MAIRSVGKMLYDWMPQKKNLINWMVEFHNFQKGHILMIYGGAIS